MVTSKIIITKKINLLSKNIDELQNLRFTKVIDLKNSHTKNLPDRIRRAASLKNPQPGIKRQDKSLLSR